MTSKSTKRALLSSVLALVVCIAMLIGTTFAWFTDTVSSTNNKIVAGNLKVDLLVYTETATDTFEWVSVKTSNAPIFDYQLWEPGYVSAKLLKVENKGSLALKWQAAIVNNQELSILADVIDVYVKPLATEDEYKALTRETLSSWEKVGTIREFISTISSTTTGTLEAEKSANLGIALKMRESANNDYMDKTIGTFDIKIFATQLASEFDSFDNQYDAGAYLPTVKTAAELASALENGESVKLGNDIEITEVINIPENAESVINLDGNDITYSSTSGYAIKSSGNLTLTGEGTIDTTASGSYGIRINGGSLVIDSADINVKGGFGAISVFNGAEVTINGGTFSNTGAAGKTSHVIYLGGYGTININDGTFTRGATGDSGATVTGYGWSNSANAKAVINITGGEFYSDFGVNGFISNYDSKWTSINITGGKYEYNPKSFVASGYEATQNADGTWTVDVKSTPITPDNYSTVAFASNTKYVLNGDFGGKNVNLNFKADGLENVVIDGSKATNIAELAVNANTTIYDGQTTGNKAGSLKITNVTEAKQLSVFAYSTNVEICNNETEFLYCLGRNIKLDIHDNVIDSDFTKYTVHHPIAMSEYAWLEYAVALNICEYDLRFDNNTVTDAKSHTIGINGYEATYANQNGSNVISSFTGNKITVNSTLKNERAAFKIWADAVYAPQSSDHSVVGATAQSLIDTIVAAESKNTFNVIDGYEHTIFCIYDAMTNN